MANVNIKFNNKDYLLSCDDGQEDSLKELAGHLDEKYNIAIRSGMHCVHSWFNSRGIEGTARASAYLYNNESDIRKFTDAIEETLSS